MNRLERRQYQLKAEKLYHLGMAKDAIAKELKISDKTIDRWEAGLEWREKRRLIQEEINRKLTESVSETMERQIKIIKGTQAKFVQQLNNPEYEVTDSAVMKAMQIEKDWVQPKTEITNIEQYNLQQNNQINIEANIHQLVEMTKNRSWKSKQISNL